MWWMVDVMVGAMSNVVCVVAGAMSSVVDHGL